MNKTPFELAGMATIQIFLKCYRFYLGKLLSKLLSDDLIGAIQQILLLGKGDRGRLEYLLDLLQKGRPLTDSDQNYLQMMVPLYLSPKDSYQQNTELVIGRLSDEIKELHQKIQQMQRKGFEKYVGRKAVLFFFTVFVGWNACQTYLQPMLSGFVSDSLISYVFPLNLVANYFNYGMVVWLGFLVLLSSWPFIGSIHLAKFIMSRKISK
ncbi:protein of unknown function [Candidatus Nitrosotalea okcheonensis]|uniref:Uncharacterized protein n=1 Tax=Candidatus Nitrosotalea okcheonensis TaxID=1903276 RepID=A0A2H1FCG4_9ARCH|nr:protein of unknown function [Candidatus Nitrosotalea okcheonensis]